MEVRLIKNKELLESVELFKIENLLWGTEKIAKTYGYIGFVPGDGLYIKLALWRLFFNLKEMIRQQMIFILTSK